MLNIYMEDIKKQLEFINEIEKLKCVERHNHTLDNNRPENSAEHSWHTAIMAMILFDKNNKNLDQLKIIKMLLIHDIVEIYAGDAFLFDDSARNEAGEKEEKAMEKLKALLPAESGNELESLWNEFEERKTHNAKYAASLDGLQPLLNHLHVKDKNFNPDNITEAMVYEKKSYIKDFSPELWPIVEETISKSKKKGLYS